MPTPKTGPKGQAPKAPKAPKAPVKPRAAGKPRELRWRTSRQIAGVRSQLQAAVAASADGAYARVDLTTARNLLEVCDQAAHTERGHGL